MRKAKIIGIFLWPIFCNKKATPTSVATLVIRVRFEPTTHSLEDCCSIQLSYQTRPLLSISVEMFHLGLCRLVLLSR